MIDTPLSFACKIRFSVIKPKYSRSNNPYRSKKHHRAVTSPLRAVKKAENGVKKAENERRKAGICRKKVEDEWMISPVLRHLPLAYPLDSMMLMAKWWKVEDEMKNIHATLHPKRVCQNENKNRNDIKLGTDYTDFFLLLICIIRA